jgi:hypothetical protein
LRTFHETVRLLTELDGADMLTQFQMGDLVLEQAPWSEEGVNNGSQDVIRRLADASGISFDTLLERRMVAFRMPPKVRTLGISYSVYLLVAKRGDPAERQRLLRMIGTEPAQTASGRWTVDYLRQYLGIRPTRYPPPSEESDASLARRLLSDREVAEEVMTDRDTRAQASAAIYRVEARERQESERYIHRSPVAGTLRSLDEEKAAVLLLETLDRTVERLREDLADVLPEVRHLGSVNLTFLRDMLRELDAVLAPVRFLAEHGEGEADAFVASVLRKQE